MKRLFIGGLIYDVFLEPLLKGIKSKVAHLVAKYDLYPVFDICCASGAQCSRIYAYGGRSVYGLDIDVLMIQYAFSKYPYIPFMCADAASAPLKDNSINGAILSYALHDKAPDLRAKMIREVKRIMSPGGKVIFVDFENPWNRKSRLAHRYVYGIEKLAGRKHFNNGRQFLQLGGLRAFTREYGLEELERHDVELAHTGIVVARFI